MWLRSHSAILDLLLVAFSNACLRNILRLQRKSKIKKEDKNWTRICMSSMVTKQWMKWTSLSHIQVSSTSQTLAVYM